jgi:hypothetical protein
MFSNQKYNARLTKLFWIVCVFLCAKTSFAQDTVSIFYQGGAFRLSPENKLLLNDFMLRNDISNVDSIALNGYAESTGKQKKNLNLSKKRCTLVKKHLQRQFGDTLIVSSYAFGEEADPTKAHLNHRRVEVVVFYKVLPASTTPFDEDFKRDTLSVHCYVLADSILSRCKKTNYRKGNLRLVQLELESHHWNEKWKVYSMSAKTGYTKQVKWKLETNGDLWWKRNRFVATVRAVDFERYGILFRVPKDADSSSCSVCDADSGSDWSLVDVPRTDIMVMQHMQLRNRPFFDEVTLVVPRKFVQPGKSYFADSLKEQSIYWHTLPGRKNSLYYFAELPAQTVTRSGWHVYGYVPTCSGSTEFYKPTYAIDSLNPHNSEPLTNGYSWMQFGLDLGGAYLNSVFGLAAAYGQFRYERSEITAKAGIDHELTGWGSLQYDFLVWGYAPFKEYYVAKTNRPVVRDFHRMLNLYIGTTATLYFPRAPMEVYQDLHAGLLFRNNGFGRNLEQIYLECGAGINYLNNLQFGIQIRSGLRFRI